MALLGAVALASVPVNAQEQPAASFPPSAAPPPTRPASTGQYPAAAPPPPADRGRAPAATPPRAAPATAHLGPYQRPAFRPEDTAKPVDPDGRIDRRYLHDGLYLRFSGGIGIGYDFIDASDERFHFASSDFKRGRHYGFAVATELAGGGTPHPGLVIGGGLYTVWVPSSSAYTRVSPGVYEFEPFQLALVGPMVDWYPFPRGGWHAQAAVGLTSFVAGQGNPAGVVATETVPIARAHTAVGYGIMLSAGYEWWVGEQIGVGPLLRMVRGWADGTDEDGVTWEHDAVGYLVMLSVTYH